MTVTTRASLIEIDVFDIDSDEALNGLRLDPYNAKRLAFLIDAEVWKAA